MEATYQQRLDGESALWGEVAAQQAAECPPEWRYHRQQRQNAIMHTANIDQLLGTIQPGMTTLELGCNAGWLTLAMAQQGADALGLDISAPAIDIARGYYEAIRERVPGTARYEVTDLNTLQLEPETYDVIAAKGVLHHLPDLDHVITQVYAALKPGGLLWVSDTNGDEATTTALVAGALTLVLPTQVPYRDKLAGLMRFRGQAASRVKASIQADGLSPFEGAGREHNWLSMIEQCFTIEQRLEHPAVTGYVTAQLTLPDWIALPFLRVLYTVDCALVGRGLLHNTGVVLWARKPAA
ncbi:MAG TPA: class I SAM-dependent methyltransferase [Aggregatilinea sp.]|jgi:2-polyprenyl-3-methyl-5-hydroxy-6-metoxy-1,4-benzoquinol methylase|uniref:class I SAM-dependent methyltransferase n=1 Tax=Aggregatilinea sp. TaxID=2806333 RepID=UPI002B98DF30|nr:class I SAM-dependent methyltransferase [Aggregatilinea sp.]HML23678.1 class I SAM-dependent methyltransferase [Aggregatilinea sp.]